MKFLCCYLLTPEKLCDRQYIGFTTDPTRRLKQHNGEISAGAKRTLQNRPWHRVLLVHGFPSKYLALRFEWDWTHPEKSHYLRDHLIAKPNGIPICRSRTLANKIRIVYELLSLEPWSSLPLTLQWTTEKHQSPKFFRELAVVPETVQIRTNAMSEESLLALSRSYALAKARLQFSLSAPCNICDQSDEAIATECPACQARFHLLCVADWFVAQQSRSALLPTKGNCPACSIDLAWHQLVFKDTRV